MKYCPYCGTANPDQNMICEACGAQLISPEDTDSQADPAGYAPVHNTVPEQQTYQQPFHHVLLPHDGLAQLHGQHVDKSALAANAVIKFLNVHHFHIA